MDQHKHHKHHLVPIPVYIRTLLALLFLTIVTVGASYINFGTANIFVALAIASLKASLVMMFFMGLKFDSWLNRAIILSSFVALALFLFMSAADLWTRKGPIPVQVSTTASALGPEEMKALAAGSPELVSKGKELFDINCAVCHGAQGDGTGVGGQALNPRPRNFHAPVGEWKFGNTPDAIYGTLAYGSPGTGMAPYKQLSPRDRWALAHYVASFGTGEKQNKNPQRSAQAMKEDSAGSGGSGKPAIPVDFAIQRMLEEHGQK